MSLILNKLSPDLQNSYDDQENVCIHMSAFM
jgi:hypothetical protein